VQFVTYRIPPSAADRIGVLDGSDVVDLTGVEALPSSLVALLALGEAGMDRVREVLAATAGVPDARTPLAAVTLRAPLPRPNSIRDFMLVEEHVLNSFGEIPDEWYEIPVYWKGNCDAVLGPEEVVRWPVYTDKLDYELEVAAVIGRRAERVSVDEARACIAGYTIFNDCSARDIQFREMKVGLGPGLGKDFATSLGPCLTTADAIDITTAPMRARINGELWSEGTLGAMRFTFPEVIAHLSEEQTLLPGDVLGSGTIGRGCGLEIDRWIAPGDVVELEVEGIGVLRNGVGPRAAVPTGANPNEELQR
jgi:2-keto-4-pentenoate hydratase/2-oxohepta-3-ene-1,7-dioic acid hydratase in catechol pathway